MSVEKWLARAFSNGVESAARTVIEEGLKSLNDQDLEHIRKIILKIQAERKANVIDTKDEST